MTQDGHFGYSTGHYEAYKLHAPSNPTTLLSLQIISPIRERQFQARIKVTLGTGL